LLKPEREAQIVRQLAGASAGILSVGELAESLGVSEMTVRRDRESLEQRGFLKRIHGGAAHVNSSLLVERSFTDRDQELHGEKAAIGRVAASMVHDGDVIMLDAGTTTLQVARHVQARRLTAVTNSLPVATELAAHEDVSAILLGGNLKAIELCTVGPMATEYLARLAADTFFLSATGFSLERGLTDPDIREVEVKSAMMRASRQVVLVADSSKFQAVRFAQIAPLDRLQAVVTDSGLPEEGRRAIEALGVEVILAETTIGDGRGHS
jgi:DeoR family transcriptional regulator, fructose operon transcriptional repressor